MKKIYLLFIAATLAACSAEPLENESLTGLDANLEGKSNNQAATQDAGESFDIPELICAGEETTFTFNFPQNTTPQGKLSQTHIFLQLLIEGDNPATAEVEESYYSNIINTQIDGAGPVYVDYVFEEAETYQLQYKIGSGQPTEFSVTVENCGCEESFNYTLNEDGTYTFTYVPAEDLDGAELTFTFPQADAEFTFEGWDHNGNGNAQTWKRNMDLIACTSYEWTVSLTRECMGSTNNNNLWTDFKVNEDSKKGELNNITQSCPE